MEEIKKVDRRIEQLEEGNKRDGEQRQSRGGITGVRGKEEGAIEVIYTR